LTVAEIVVGKVGSNGGTTGNPFSGNTLVVATDTTARVKSVKNAENYEFVLPANAHSGYTALEAETITFGNGDGGVKSKVTDISFRGGGSAMQPGDTLRLFASTGAEAIDFSKLTGLAGQSIPGRKGISLLYEYELLNDGTARVSSVRVNPQTKALSEGRVAGAAFLNQGGDLLADKGISAAVAGANASHGLSAFALTSGGWSRYDTGSHVEVSGVSLLAGMAIGGDLPVGRVTVGGFFESGWGNYDTSNSFGGFASVDGSGDTSYVGGGAFGRLDLKNTGPGHFYGELSGRIGTQYTDFSSGDLNIPGDSRKAKYNLDGAYYGLHAGAGYLWNITDAASLDLSGKYFWTHQEGGSVTILDDPFRFDDVDSHRVRAGGRFSYAVNEHFSPYIGAAYEYEFSGEAKATTYGRSLDAPDLTGSTGVGEIGVTLLGGKDAPVSLDLGVQGYAGMRQGMTGSLQLKIEF
jgi:outer membrane autotransporter protein